jgi:hypothetical protein
MREFEFPFCSDVPSANASSIDSSGSPPVIRRIVRPGTGLIIVTAPHGALSTTARTAVARFRLRQYVLAGLYDPVRARQYDDQGDPALQTLTDDDLHIAVGDDTGRFLAYLCAQSAPYFVERSDTRKSSSLWSRRRYDVTARLWQRNRPQFPVEIEYGVIYSIHPGLRALPMHTVREFSRLLRNQDPTLRRDPLARLAIAETLLAGVRAVSDRTMGIDAIVGFALPQTRRVLAALGIPVAYAPDAPFVGDKLGGASRSSTSEPLWTSAAYQEGRFWPCAISSVDLRLDRAYYDELDAVLTRHLDAEDVLRLFMHRRMGAPRRRARYAVENSARGSFRWTDAPFFNTEGMDWGHAEGATVRPRRVLSRPLGHDQIDASDTLDVSDSSGTEHEDSQRAS